MKPTLSRQIGNRKQSFRTSTAGPIRNTSASWEIHPVYAITTQSKRSDARLTPIGREGFPHSARTSISKLSPQLWSVGMGE